MMIAPSPGPLSKHFGKAVREAFGGDLQQLKEEDEDDVVDVTDDIVDVTEDVVDVTEDIVDVTEDVVDVTEDDVVDVTEDVVDVTENDVTEDVDVTESAQDKDDVVYYKNARVQYEFDDMRKENGVYFLPLKTPVMIQTPVVRLVNPLQGDSTALQVSDNFEKFVCAHDDSVLRVTKENKGTWFRKHIEDRSLEEGFKSFLDSNTLKVKISEEVASFDVDGQFIDNDFCVPAEVVCILKISGIWFGSMEFGSIMSLVQVQLVRSPKCSIKSARENVNYSAEFE